MADHQDTSTFRFVLAIDPDTIRALASIWTKQDPTVLQRLDQIQTTLGEIKVTDTEVKAVLDKVDVTTTKISTNLDAVASAQASEANVIQTISDEIDALVANAGSNGISATTAAQLQAIADRLQTSSDNSDAIAAATAAQVPVLAAIAAKGSTTVPPPPPPPAIP